MKPLTLESLLELDIDDLQYLNDKLTESLNQYNKASDGFYNVGIEFNFNHYLNDSLTLVRQALNLKQNEE